MNVSFSGDINDEDKFTISNILSGWRHSEKTELFRINLKKEGKLGKDRYEVDLNVSTKFGKFTAQVEGWILTLVLKSALRKIERQFKHKERGFKENKFGSRLRWILRR